VAAGNGPAAANAATKAAQPAKPVVKAPAQKVASSKAISTAPDTRVTQSAPPAPPAPVTIAQAQPAAKTVCHDCGVIESVREVAQAGKGSGLGAAAGGVLGGVLGHQVGGGRGRDVMTVVGAVGGAVAGHQVEKNMKKSVSYEVTVRFDDGTTRTLQQTSAPAWRPGDKVRVVNSEIQPNG
jgi:outer membrane lipoprotein SlyB